MSVREDLGTLREDLCNAVVIEAYALLDSLGEYVRQTMDNNPEWSRGIRSLEEAVMAYRKVYGSPQLGTTGGDWGQSRRYHSDDRDLERGDNDLLVFMGNNGDWYISIVKHGEKIGPAVRLTTSGTPRGFEGVPAAVAKLYQALP